MPPSACMPRVQYYCPSRIYPAIPYYSNIINLHISVFYTIMNHFNIVTSTFFTNPITTCIFFTLGTNSLKYIFNMGPGLGMTPRHQRGSITCPFFPSRDPRTHIEQSFLFQFPASSGGVLVFRISSVYYRERAKLLIGVEFDPVLLLAVLNSDLTKFLLCTKHSGGQKKKSGQKTREMK